MQKPARIILFLIGTGFALLAGHTATASAAPLTTTTLGSITANNSPSNAPDLGGFSNGGSNNGGAEATTPGTVASTSPNAPQAPTTPVSPSGSSSSNGSVSVNLGGALSKPSSSLEVIIGLTLLSVAPSLLIMLTSFSRIIIVLSLTRQALGLQSVPPNQVLVGLALFLSLFIMSPVISQVNNQAVQPYLKGTITAQVAYTKAEVPLKAWMLKQTNSSDLALFDTSTPKPASASEMPMTSVIPAFILSEIKTAFIIGFVIFIPFLVIDLIVSSTLMSMGMMMLPPSLVSLPFKLLLFVLVDGWALVIKSLLSSFH